MQRRVSEVVRCLEPTDPFRVEAERIGEELAKREMTPVEMARAGFPHDVLRKAGFTTEELYDAGVLVDRADGIHPLELQEAGYRGFELRQAGYQPVRRPPAGSIPRSPLRPLPCATRPVPGALPASHVIEIGCYHGGRGAETRA